MSIRQNIETLQQKVSQAAQKCGRDPEGIQILYVTKTVETGRIREAISAGAKDFGENRVQELLEKKKDFNEKDLRWHLIGHLQTNKVKQVLGETVLIHSLDRLELAEKIEQQAVAQKIKSVPCLVQVNTSGETTKFGLLPSEVEAFSAKITGPALQIRGLMTIGPLTENRDKIRASFRALRELRDSLRRKMPRHSWDILSMGMSGDFEIAIEEGSTLIRVGTAIFGERK